MLCTQGRADCVVSTLGYILLAPLGRPSVAGSCSEDFGGAAGVFEGLSQLLKEELGRFGHESCFVFFVEDEMGGSGDAHLCEAQSGALP